MGVDKQEARVFLTADGGATPGSRYGRHSEDCWELAYAVAEIAAEANGDPIDEEALDYYMGLVVNDSDDIESLILAHGTAEHRYLHA